jgi:hypothetical protein
MQFGLRLHREKNRLLHWKNSHQFTKKNQCEKKNTNQSQKSLWKKNENQMQKSHAR